MKKILFILSLFFLTQCHTNGQGHKIKMEVKGAANLKATLAHYYEDQFITVKEATFDSKAIVTFTDTEKLDGGVYMLVVGEKGYFDFLITDDQDFILTTDTSDFVKNMKVKGSEENEIFYAHQKQIQEISLKIDKLEEQKKQSTDSAKINQINIEIAVLNKEFENKWRVTAEKYPDAFFTKLLRAMYSFYATDDPLSYVDFTDPRLIRTPFFYNIIRHHIAKNIEQTTNIINQENDKLLKLCTNDTVFQYISIYLLNFYRTFTKNGMNEVFVNIADKYFLNNNTWIDSASVTMIKKQREIYASSMVGAKAYDFKFLTTTADSLTVTNINDGKFLLLFFWSVGCGHCETAAESIKKRYDKLQTMDIKILGINTDAKTIDEWKKYIDKQGYTWNNGIDTNQLSRFREYYYVASTPIMYVIDNKGTIVNKMFGEIQIEDFLKYITNQ